MCTKIAAHPDQCNINIALIYSVKASFISVYSIKHDFTLLKSLLIVCYIEFPKIALRTLP